MGQKNDNIKVDSEMLQAPPQRQDYKPLLKVMVYLLSESTEYTVFINLRREGEEIPNFSAFSLN